MEQIETKIEYHKYRLYEKIIDTTENIIRLFKGLGKTAS